MKPLFTIALIARNEAKTLPKLVVSLHEFQKRGGEILLCDTGSTDGTAEIARELGCTVHEVGEKFLVNLTEEMAEEINKKFIVEGEAPIVKAGDRIFDFASARNYIADFSSTDFVANPDCDEIYTTLDIDMIDERISNGAEQFEYDFVYAHDDDGNPTIQFKHSKFYDRKKMKWVGVVHEVLQGYAKMEYLPPTIIKLEHWQNPETNRSQYLTGLAYDCFIHPENDRNAHYFGRELMYRNRFKSAIEHFKKHIEMKKWPTEAAQSMTYIGDCLMYLGRPEEAFGWYIQSFNHEPNRREPLMKLAEYFKQKGKWQQAVSFALAALDVKGINYYSNYQPYYEEIPHEILYLGYWYLGNKEKSKEHFMIASKFSPEKYKNDAEFFN